MILHDTPRPVRFRRFTRTAHLMSSLPGAEGTAELDAFARRIGLEVRWRQNTGTPTEHYDLFDGAIGRAVDAGSVEVTGRELIERVVRPKRAALAPTLPPELPSMPAGMISREGYEPTEEIEITSQEAPVGDGTGIEWTDATWNPIRGCSRVSEGCRHCYAETVASRFSGEGQPYEGLVWGGRWTGEVRVVPEMFTRPLRWKRPRQVFVNSMSDLFHPAVSSETRARVFGVMAVAQQHTFQVLTKRPEEALEWFREWNIQDAVASMGEHYARQVRPGFTWDSRGSQTHLYPPGAQGRVQNRMPWPGWPLPNVHLGVSIEDQKTANDRLRYLLQTPAALHWASIEPLLGPLDLETVNDGSWYDVEGASLYNALTGHAYYHDGEHGLGGGPRLGWVVVGGESGDGARPMHPEWARTIRDACVRSHVPFLFKQWGEWLPDSEVGIRADPDLDVDVITGKYRSTAIGAIPGKVPQSLHTLHRVGKERAGRSIDGRTWDETPVSR